MSATVRQVELRKILEDRRAEIAADLQARVRNVRDRAATSDAADVADAAESAELDMQDEMRFALMQMKAETLERVDEALRRLNEGTFGVCVDCGDDIAERRLRALPFALRCTSCEQARESAKPSAASVPRRFPGTIFELQ